MSTISLFREGAQQELTLQIKDGRDNVWPDEGNCVVTHKANKLPRQSFPDPVKGGHLNTFTNTRSSCDDSDKLSTVVSTIFDECRGVKVVKRRHHPKRCRHQGTPGGRLVPFKVTSLQTDLTCEWKSVVSHLLDEIGFDRNTEKAPTLHEDSCCDNHRRKGSPLVLSSQHHFSRNETSVAIIPKLYAFPPTPAQLFEDFSCNRFRQVIVSTPSCGASMVNRPGQFPYQTPFVDKASCPVLMGRHLVCVDMGIQITVSPLTRT